MNHIIQKIISERKRSSRTSLSLSRDKNLTSCDSCQVAETRGVQLLRSNLSWRSRQTSRARTFNVGVEAAGRARLRCHENLPVCVSNCRLDDAVFARRPRARAAAARPGGAGWGAPRARPASRPPGQPRGPTLALRPRFQVRSEKLARRHVVPTGGEGAGPASPRGSGGKAGPGALPLPRPPRPE